MDDHFDISHVFEISKSNIAEWSVNGINSLLDSRYFFHLLITIAHCLDPDQNVGPDLAPNRLTLKEFFEKVNLEKSQQRTRNA